MGRIEKTVFISYRRADESWARAVFGDLYHHGYDVFIDYDGIASGSFETVILENIRARAHFLVLLTPTALERCGDPNDWMRREIEAALDSRRNIVPLMLEGFKFDAPDIASQPTEKLAALKEYNGLRIPEGYFSPAMERLRKFLNVPLDTVLHPASLTALVAATEQKDKAARALAEKVRRQEDEAEAQRIAEERRQLEAEAARQAREQEERKRGEEAIQLSGDDFDHLSNVLSQHGEWQAVRSRIDFLVDVLVGSPRNVELRAQLDLDGTPRATAVRTIQRLMTFGQDQLGREALGVLINKLIASRGGGEEADFLRELLTRYPFTTQPVAVHAMERWHGNETDAAVAEKIIGENTLRDVYFLEVLLDLVAGVVRVHGPEIGTGFLISPDLLMTNQHVISSVAIAKECTFQFNYQLDRTGRALPVQTARALDGGLFRMSPMAPHNATIHELDYTIVQLTDVPKSAHCLKLRPTAIQRDSRLTIIQHPGGDYKKISMQNNFVEYVDEFVVQYTTSTEPSSSGSPVLNDDFDVVAIHHSGGQLTEPTTKRRYFRNEGVRLSAIIDDLRRHAPDIYQLVIG
jgi:V8-like Glu-specific endopeptidase